MRSQAAQPDLILQTLRSHDQYNTTLYGLDDRYRGVKGMREVVFVNPADIQRLGLTPGQKVDLLSLWDDGIERRVQGFTLLAYDTPLGQAGQFRHGQPHADLEVRRHPRAAGAGVAADRPGRLNFG
ncbi:putative oxidoreductase [compost metagenome]